MLFLFCPGYNYMRPLSRQDIPHSSKLLGWPATFGITCSWMKGNERFLLFRDNPSRLDQVLLDDRDARFQHGNLCPYQGDNVQIANDFRLEVDIWQPSIKRGSIWCFQADRHAGTEAQKEWVRVAPTTMKLDSETEAFLVHVLEELLLFRKIFHETRLLVHALRNGDNNNPINRPRPVRQEVCVPLFGEQNDFSLGIGNT